MAAIPLVAAFARADTNVVSLSLEDCVHQALQRNLVLEISRVSPELARMNLEVSRMAFDPSLRLSTDISTASTPGGVDEQSRVFAGTETDSERYNATIAGSAISGLDYSIGGNLQHREGVNPGLFENTFGSANISLSQPLLRNAWIDSTRMNIQINRNNVRVSELGLQQAIMNLVTRVERAYYDLILARNAVDVQREAKALTEKLLAANRQRVKVGVMAPLDEKQAESQLAAREASLRSARRNLVTQEYNLKRLLTDDIATWSAIDIRPAEVLVAVPQAFDLHESWGIALRRRPEILQSRLNVESDGITLRFRKNQLYPQLDLVASASYSGSRREYNGVVDDILDRSSPRYSIGGVLNIPLGNRNARKQLELQRLRNERTLLNLKELEQSIMTEVALDIEAARAAYDQVATTRKSREFAEEALAAEEKKLAVGNSTSFVVLQLQRDLTTARSAEINALADYNKALATLALSEGRTLERLKLNLTIE
ncbi:MAG: TolC family protein [Verrucomicrobiae bacterium]|jgi:outer membrane protein|nr:TolC family protein [Verrucomicrobiae bacterium]